MIITPIIQYHETPAFPREIAEIRHTIREHHPNFGLCGVDLWGDITDERDVDAPSCVVCDEMDESDICPWTGLECDCVG